MRKAQQEAGIPGTVHFQKIEVSGNITVEGDLVFDGFIGFSLSEPASTPTSGDIDIKIDRQTEYPLSISTSDSPALKEALNRINNEDDVTLWMIFGQRNYDSTGGATVTVEIENVRLRVTWTAW
ncbi:hypothetical protein [Thermotoga sp. SG1]|uniref:hypothetical protein n=1 Tax=Thermotoga sp. SG1 TaxID=126739 RepID=UPI001E3B61DC|nr:hypothetical protein [Thermotoga sp. SG1]